MAPYDEITIIPSSGGKLPSEDGIITINDKYYKVSPRTILLIRCLHSSETIEEAIQAFIKASPTPYNDNQVLFIVNNAINPLFAKKEMPSRPLGFLLKKALIPENAVKLISGKLSFLFNRFVILLICVFSAILSIAYLLQPDVLTYNSRISLEGILVIALVTVISSLIHELGHAAACINYGISPGHIGFGIYLNFPLFYTDVTKIWTLPSRQRHAINFAGVYFQCILLCILLPLYFTFGNEIVKFIILTTMLSFIVTLNPFFKFDGYWIISDILDIPNLREHTYVWLKSRFGKSKIAHQQASLLTRLSKTKLLLFMVYSICSTAFMLAYFFYIIPYIIITNGSMFFDDLTLMISYITHLVTPPFSIVKNVLSYVIFVSTVCYLLYGMIRTIIRRV